MCKIPSYSPVILSPALRPYAHLEALDPNLGESGSSSMAGDIFGIFSNGNDFCFEEAAFRDRSANPTFHEAYDWDKENYWIMKDPKRPPGIDNLDWDKTDPRFHPYPRPKHTLNKQTKRSRSAKPSSPRKMAKKSGRAVGLPVKKAVIPAAAAQAQVDSSMARTSSSSSSSESEDDDFDDGVSISSSDACLLRALNGETFEGEYDEESSTSSSGTSSDGSAEESLSKSDLAAAAVGTSSPFDALRSSPATSMISDYISRLDRPDECVNLTRSYKVPVGPSKKLHSSKKKPLMNFSPKKELGGVNLAKFIKAIVNDDLSAAEKIELDEDAPSDGQYIEMDLALGVLEEKPDREDVTLQSPSSDESSEDGEDADAIVHLTNIKTKGEKVRRSKAIIEEL